MVPSRYFLRETIEVNASYEELTHVVRKNLNTWFYKGYIDPDETQVFFTSPNPAGYALRDVPLPVIQVNFKNHQTTGGKIEIQFKVVTFAKVVGILLTVGLSFGMSAFAGRINDLTWEVYVVPPLIGLVVYWTMYYQFLMRKDDLMTLIDRTAIK